MGDTAFCVEREKEEVQGGRHPSPDPERVHKSGTSIAAADALEEYLWECNPELLDELECSDLADAATAVVDSLVSDGQVYTAQAFEDTQKRAERAEAEVDRVRRHETDTAEAANRRIDKLESQVVTWQNAAEERDEQLQEANDRAALAQQDVARLRRELRARGYEVR